MLDSGATRLDGRLPINPSGGLLARGHPPGASGLAQIFEVVTQMRGEAGPRQVRRADSVLAQIMGGSKGNDSQACAVHILSRDLDG
jgi:acetyl-CoA acetyltransferase